MVASKSSARPPSGPPATGSPADETAEHLQIAAREMLAAARSFLDVVEEVVSDPDRLAAATTSITDLLGTAGQSIATIAERISGSGRGESSGEARPATPRPRVRRVDVD